MNRPPETPGENLLLDRPGDSFVSGGDPDAASWKLSLDVGHDPPVRVAYET
jgi:hypothetical protein